MKNIFFKTIAAVAIILGSIACTNDSTDSKAKYRSSFLDSSEIGAYVKGVAVKSYNAETDQVIYDDSRSMYMISDMNCTDYYSLSFSGSFIIDFTVFVTCQTTGVNGLINDNQYIMTVVQAEDSDKIYWLWDSDTSTGFVVNFTL
ncbi:MAG: hypothetical protein SNI45_02550 [Rikenellaceae bacterium]